MTDSRIPRFYQLSVEERLRDWRVPWSQPALERAGAASGGQRHRVDAVLERDRYAGERQCSVAAATIAVQRRGRRQ